MTPYELHVSQWKNCTRCSLHKTRLNVVIGRGSLPASVVFIGEAPGDNEDAHGLPFWGPAGEMLDSIIAKAVPIEVSYAITNLVGCIPRDEGGAKDGQPEEEAILACRPRLVEFVKLASPKLLVTVGKMAKDWTEQDYLDSIQWDEPVPSIDIMHPAYILLANYAQRGLLKQRCVIAIAKAIEQYITHGGPDASTE